MFSPLIYTWRNLRPEANWFFHLRSAYEWANIESSNKATSYNIGKCSMCISTSTISTTDRFLARYCRDVTTLPVTSSTCGVLYCKLFFLKFSHMIFSEVDYRNVIFKVKDGLRDIAPRGQTRNTMWDSHDYRVEHDQYYDISVIWEVWPDCYIDTLSCWVIDIFILGRSCTLQVFTKTLVAPL